MLKATHVFVLLNVNQLFKQLDRKQPAWPGPGPGPPMGVQDLGLQRCFLCILCLHGSIDACTKECAVFNIIFY